jgi:hypothetical protein
MRTVRKSLGVLVALLAAASISADERYLWRTASDIRGGATGSIVGSVVDVSEGRNELTLAPDDATSAQVIVVSDALTTQFNGFGGVINGKPEIFTGSPGFANLRRGDRIEVRGTGRSAGTLMAETITLLGRPVPASQTGVGTTRSPTSVSTPATQSSTTPGGRRYGSVEGVVQQVNANDNRIVIVTDGREVMTVRTTSDTPVYYRGSTYHVRDLEVGDRIRVDADETNRSTEVYARSIQVTQSAQETAGTRVTTIGGRVTQIDRATDIVRIDTGRGSVRVDVSTATDEQGRRVRASDFVVGDRVDVSGRYGTAANDVFVATSVRFNDAPRTGVPNQTIDVPASRGELAIVTLYGTVRETFDAGPQLMIRDSGGRTIAVNVVEDFLVKTKSGGTTLAERLKVGDSVVVKAYRDGDGNYIAQTIRMR